MRTHGVALACTAVFVVTLGWVLSAADGKDKDKDALNPNKVERARIEQGLALTPVPVDLRGRDSDLVGLGSYIVNAVGGCNDCHTWPNYAPGHDPFLGQPKQVNVTHFLAGGRDFGPFLSRNLTRVPETHSVDDFLKMMRTGVDPHPNIHPGIPLLQVMPWPVYQDMSDHDLRAIYEYLSAIPDAARCASVGPLSNTQNDPTCVL
jgi:hypothetical protein